MGSRFHPRGGDPRVLILLTTTHFIPPRTLAKCSKISKVPHFADIFGASDVFDFVI